MNEHDFERVDRALAEIKCRLDELKFMLHDVPGVRLVIPECEPIDYNEHYPASRGRRFTP